MPAAKPKDDRQELLETILSLERDVQDLQFKMKQHKNKEHTWRLLYQDLLREVSKKLDRIEQARRD